MILLNYQSPFNDDVPPGFDPAAHPIIATHWYGVSLETMKRARLAGHLHKFGPRPLLEFLNEVVAVNGIGPDIDQRLERYGRLDPVTVAQVRGRHLPKPPLMAVRP